MYVKSVTRFIKKELTEGAEGTDQHGGTKARS